MNADDLRRLTQDATERAKHEEQEALKRAAENEQLASKYLYEAHWATAREAVAELETTLRKAASEGTRELHVYSFNSSKEFPATVTCVRRLFSYDQITKGCKDHRYSYRVPDYAQYVYDHCSRLNPRWSPGCSNLPCGRGGRETYFDGHGSGLGGQNYCYFFLYVSW
jgi:hypothetical protein